MTEFLKDIRAKMQMAAWLYQRETDTRSGHEIVEDALKAARHDLTNVLGAAGAVDALMRLAAAIEDEAGE